MNRGRGRPSGSLSGRVYGAGRRTVPWCRWRFPSGWASQWRRPLTRCARREWLGPSPCVREAKEWAADPGAAPEWLPGVWGERMARAAQREYQREQQREQQAMRELAVEQSALEKVKAGKRRFTDDEWLYVQDWAFEAAKGLVRGGPGDEVSGFDYQVLRAVGVDPEDHAAWPIHMGGCDGEGELHCAERIGQVRAERRAAALIESVAKETALREAGFSPGQMVTVWDGQRVGVVAKVNKVSVKVRLVGGQRDQHALVEKNLGACICNGRYI